MISLGACSSCYSQLLATAFAAAQDRIILTCDLSGEQKLTSSKYPEEVRKISGVATYVVEQSPQGYWSIQEGSILPVRTQSDLESARNNEKEPYFSAIVSVGENIILKEEQRRIPAYKDKSGEEKPMYWIDEKLTINRISGQINSKATIEAKYADGFKAKTFMNQSGVCRATARKF